MTRVAKEVSRLLNFLRRLRLARARYGRSYPELLAEFRDLRRNGGFTPKEIFMADLLKREPRERKRQSTIGKKALIALQRRINPEEAAELVEDKSLFYPLCRDRGLPIPRLYAVWAPDGGRTAEGVALRTDSDWSALFDSLKAQEIVIKPSLGVYGCGIRFLRHCGQSWRDADGRSLSAADVLQDLRQDPDFDRFVIQERVTPHASLVDLSATDYLQTLRVITGVTGDSDVHILCAEQKIICGTATTSNFAWGATGNAVSDVDLASGKLGPVFIAREDGVGMDPIARHPVTGKSFDGFVVPLWDETCDLCRNAALAFLPLRTIGWDVAATPHGPVLIEGNAWWDPHTHARSMGPVLRYARSMLDAT
ncbi:MAG: sugar-transfer associated ATP-grasp domain-containing protein [Kiloniellales bacterium]